MRGARLGAAAPRGGSAGTRPAIAAPGVRLGLGTVRLLRMLRLTAGAVPSTARPARGGPLGTVARPVVIVVVPRTTAALGASPALAPAVVAAGVFRQMADAVRMERLARGRALGVAVRRVGIAEPRQTIAVLGASQALAVAAPSRVMASVARTAKRAPARPLGPAARSLACVEAQVPNAALAVKTALALVALRARTSPQMGSVARQTARHALVRDLVAAARLLAPVVTTRLTAARDGKMSSPPRDGNRH